MKKCKNIFAFGGPCDVQKWVKVYKVYVSWKPWLFSLRRHQKKWFLSNWGRTRCNRSAPKVWKWPIVHRSKFWPIYKYVCNWAAQKQADLRQTWVYYPFASTHMVNTLTPTCPKCAYKILQIFSWGFEFALAEKPRNPRKYCKYFRVYSNDFKFGSGYCFSQGHPHLIILCISCFSALSRRWLTGLIMTLPWIPGRHSLSR